MLNIYSLLQTNPDFKIEGKYAKFGLIIEFCSRNFIAKKHFVILRHTLEKKSSLFSSERPCPDFMM